MNTEIQEALRKLEQAKALLKGAFEGKTIEPINRTDKDWEVIEILLHPEEYRLKPILKHAWMNQYHGHSTIHESESAARVAADPVSTIRVAVPCIIQEA